MRRWSPTLCALVLATLPSACGRIAGDQAVPGRTPRPVVAIVPLGDVAGRDTEQVRGAISSSFDVDVVVLARTELPASAWFEPRKRYLAPKLLEFLEAGYSSTYTKVIGVTRADISVPKAEGGDWGIFGLGSVGGPPCVVSTYRLGHGGVRREQVFERLRRVSNHEIGHTFGLPHCPTRGCVVEDARGRIATVDSGTGDFCAGCLRLLADAGGAPRNAHPPSP
jgi:archaemetzincin